MTKDIDNFSNMLEANKKLGVLGCSPKIFDCLEMANDSFLDDILNALVKFTMIEGENINKFARYKTSEGYVCIYSYVGDEENKNILHTNIMFSDEGPLNY